MLGRILYHLAQKMCGWHDNNLKNYLMDKNMKAQVINSFGDPSVFTLIDLPIPEIKPGHVLIKVYATSVNPIDCKIRSGVVSAIAPQFPAVLHGDLAGVVESIGEGVTQFKKGDEVYGCAGISGALAEFILVDAHLIAKKPKSLSMKEAAALPLVSITAWIALFEKAHLKKRAQILVHGGVGGVGHIAVQLAKWHDATVYTTVRKNEDFPVAKSLGADEIIHSEQENIEQYKLRLTQNLGFETIFDTVGGDNLKNSFVLAASNGTIVTTAARSIQDLTIMHNKGLSLHCVFMLLPMLSHQKNIGYGKILDNISQIVDEGKLKILIDPHSFTLDEIAKAHNYFESRKVRGKVVISVVSH